jgi:hypothetical protein
MIVCLLSLLVSGAAFAVPITFMQQGHGSGFIGGVSFNNTDFTVYATADTDNRLAYRSGYFVDNTRASISIGGVGEYRFLTDTRFFVNTIGGTVGFSRAGTNGLDLFNGPTSPAFVSWDMLSEIGPVMGRGWLLQWTHSDVVTDTGILKFNPGLTCAVFQAETGAAPVPEPLSMTLLGAGLACMGLLKRTMRV